MVKAIYFDYEGATIYRMTPIGDRLRKLRKTLGLNQGAVADHVGASAHHHQRPTGGATSGRTRRQVITGDPSLRA